MNGNIASIYAQSGWILLTVLAILVLMSMMTWIIALIRCYCLWCAKRDNRAALSCFATVENLAQLQHELAGNQSPVALLTRNALQACKLYHDKANHSLAAAMPFNQYLSSQIRNSMEQIMRRYESGLTVLASISSSAPFIGLFGTVWGIYHALINIGQSGQMSIAVVAGPIGEALVSTAIGLFAAIPALLFYNFLVRSKKNLSRDLDGFAHDLHAQLLNNEDK
ncbi:MAG: MotA/TolQ/ExbB proton channel family protein [Snodgrassella sp.]|uniref:MotA/TolQ/ExbB proton channel family protein n=1 Tax=Snodgrassella TaxID=1193515 RepID=UPI000B812E77|nr:MULTISPECIES: MotA/TolQ/ExbB proton channel family protein [Snodgrassella]MCO6507979.1 MotA/TolQ/ExbB proton channel family protein [Snodgrassella sp.]MCO6519324.1 MotA/TolQ/ExbB proton channel family protein [Snodgrassella sp.]MCO6525784.1 MotA/TolQ/ExbB proton channel family protein [Snodgrassella sp.]